MSTSLPVAEAELFASPDALQKAHAVLRDARNQHGLNPQLVEQIETFLKRAQASGKVIFGERNRWAAQSLLNYWASILDSTGHVPVDALLEEFDPLLAPEIPEADCPYLGLDAFDEASHQKFFGRQALINSLVTHLHNQRLLVVVGPSGSGKSSLVRAGLIPALKMQRDLHERFWSPEPTVPGSNPLLNLARCIPARFIQTNAAVSAADWYAKQAELLSNNPNHLADLLNRFQRPAALVIDQFEELFTLVSDEQIRRSYIACLLGVLNTSRYRHVVILTIRNDFATYTARYPMFHTLFEAAGEPVTTMSLQDMREAIELPAARVGLRFEDGVVDQLVDELAGEPAALPLLQFTLLELWRQRQRNLITMKTYTNIGGGRKALARSADHLYNGLIDEQKTVVREIFLKMVRPGTVVFTAGGGASAEVSDQLSREFTSYRIPLRTLRTIRRSPELVQHVLDKLVAAKLVRLTQRDSDADTQVEVAHEALVRNWPQLERWLAESREELLKRHRFREAADLWLARGKDKRILLPEPLFDEARHYDDRTPEETAFLLASGTALLEAKYEQKRIETERQQAEADRQKAQQREVEQAHELVKEQKLRLATEQQRAKERDRAARRLWLALAVLALSLVVVLALAFYTANLARTAGAAATTESNLRQVAEKAASQIAYGRATAEVAKQNAETAAAKEAQQRMTAEIASTNEAVQSRNAETSAAQALQQQATAEIAAVKAQTAAAQSENQRAAAQAEREKSDTYSATREALLAAVQATQNVLAARATVISSQLDQVQQGFVQQTAATAQQIPGQLVAKVPSLISRDPYRALRVALEAAYREQSQRTEDMLQLAIAANVPPLRHGRDISSATWSPNSNYLLTTSDDRVAKIWQVSDQATELQSLSGHTGTVTSASWSSDSTRIVTTSRDGTAMIWDAQRGTPLLTLRHGGQVYSAAWSPDDSRVVTTSEDGIQLWDTATGQRIGAPFGGAGERVSRDAWNPAGTQIISAAGTDGAHVWDVNSGSILFTINQHTKAVKSTAWNTNGQYVATGSADGTAGVWNAQNGNQAQIFAVNSPVNSVAWSSSGRTLLAGGNDSKVHFYFSGAEQAILTGGDVPVTATTFSPDRLRIVVGSADGTLRLYYVETAAIIQQAQRLTNNQRLNDAEIQDILNDR